MRNARTTIINEFGARATSATRWWGRLGILCLILAATAMASMAQTTDRPTYSVLYNFTGGADGGNPNSGLIADQVGNLYGTTQDAGNTSSSCPFGVLGCGVVFKLDPAGTETTLYTFTGGTDGDGPLAGVIRDAAGNLYGTTNWGGNLTACPGYGCGVVFKLDPAGKETVLYTFSGGADGGSPMSGVIRDAAGNLYGTTFEGGITGSSCPYGCGVVYEVNPSGKETVLYTFSGGTDGSNPASSLILDGAGNLYGTTYNGGNTGSSCNDGGGSGTGCGVVFKVDPSGKETVLYAFTGVPDGDDSNAGLIRDRNGNLYGTTVYGGNNSGSCPQNGLLGCGVVFKIDPTRKDTVLYTFTGGTDGYLPWETGVVRDKTGNLYGTATAGGDSSCSDPAFAYDTGCGVVFELNPSGKYTVLHTFTGIDGAGPAYGSLLLHKDFLYGATYSGGAYSSSSCFGPGCGVLFKVH